MVGLNVWSDNSCLIYCEQACKLKQRDLKGALLDAEFAVRDGENNAKAYFRQGQVGGVVLANIWVVCVREVIDCHNSASRLSSVC